MTKLIRMGLIVIAGIMVAGGLGFMFFPALMETDFGVVASRLDGMGTLRADLGGAFLALALFTFMGTLKGREDWILVPAVFMGLFLSAPATISRAAESAGAQTNVYFGDTHVHSSYSFDAYLNSNQSADPDTAYRWAKGMPVIHPYNRARVQIGTPLDFLVVADHAEMLGVMKAIQDDTVHFEDMGFFGNIKRWISVKFLNNAIDTDAGLQFFGRFLPVSAKTPGADPVADPANNIKDVSIFGDTSKTQMSTWQDIIETADRHNEPGKFTSLIGWEWSSVPTGANLHRVIITPDDAKIASQFLPYGSDISQYPEDLWQWLEDTQVRTGARFIAIPHNSNISKGYMFGATTLKGQPITVNYARTRMNWEPVVEATQIKGDSETRSEFSPDDEFAEFQKFDHYIQTGNQPFKLHPGDYIRPALKQGLAIEQQIGVNPFKFGLIGSTDSHSGLSSAEENNFWGKVAKDSTPETKNDGRERPVSFDGWDMSAAGLAAVWAKENTREEIYAAFKRKEVYATTGTRLRVQLFAGWDFPVTAVSDTEFANIGYRQGVPMGGDLMPAPDGDAAPQFLIRAVKDPKGANLDRIQMIKGWVDANGQQFEKIYNVVWSDNRELSANGSLPSVGNTVDTSIPRYENTIGGQELVTRWIDPNFDPGQRAFYYARVLEIPTPRNAMFDAIALGLDAPPKGPKTLQERAYTSPVWYTPIK